MRAMVLAAGLGSRLRPLTNDRPKALVEVGGRTLLEITLARLRSFGVSDVIINVHHFAGMVVEYLKSHDNFGMHLEISHEQELLDTGGGLKKAAKFFLNAGDNAAFILHNVDVISTIDLDHMVKLHDQQQALATLAVQSRKTSRYLLFDHNSQLCGRRAGEDGTPELVRSSGDVELLAFSGIHVISPALLQKMTEDGAFSIITTYLRLASEDEKIMAFRADQYEWRDMGKVENVKPAAQN